LEPYSSFPFGTRKKNLHTSIRQTRESIALGKIECKDFYPLSPIKYFYFFLCLISLLLTIYLWGDEWMRVVSFGVLLFSLWELWRLFKYPVMRITDELLILDHDNLSIDWQDVKSIMLEKEKRKLRIEVEFIEKIGALKDKPPYPLHRKKTLKFRTNDTEKISELIKEKSERYGFSLKVN
jgi:hypothetical protein